MVGGYRGKYISWPNFPPKVFSEQTKGPLVGLNHNKGYRGNMGGLHYSLESPSKPPSISGPGNKVFFLRALVDSINETW